MKQQLIACCISFLCTAMYAAASPAEKDGVGRVPALGDGRSAQFIENKGQVTDQHGAVRRDIDVKIEANGVMMFVGDGELRYQWVKSGESGASFRREEPTPTSRHGGTGSPKRGSIDNSPLEGGKGDVLTQQYVEIYRMDVQLVGANKNAEVIFEEPTGYYENYYLAHTGEDGVRARGFQKVIYKDIYPNIDLVLYSPNPAFPRGEGGGEKKVSPLGGDLEGAYSRRIKYDFIVHPGGNPADIKLRYEGATEVKLIDGALVATTPFGTITEDIPYSYCKETGEEVASAFVLDGNQLSFNTGGYTGTLVIDPFLRWGTYFGGNLVDRAHDVHTSYDGYIYIAGRSSSTANLATTGAYRTTMAGTTDAFIAKFDDSCRLQWATYYGGHKGDNAWGITGDRLGNIYICGATNSDTGIATTGAHQALHGDYPLLPNEPENHDVFLAKFSSGGQRLWGTYMGGRGDDRAYDIVCDGNNDIYICGQTYSIGAIATTGAFIDTFLPDRPNAFITKFNGAGQRLWGTYFADSNGQILYALACDAQNNIYTGGRAGQSKTSGTLGTAGTHQPNPVGGTYLDGILAKFSGSGSRLWCTYYGGAFNEYLFDIVCNDSGHLYATGSAISTTHIASTGAHQTSPNGTDAFLVKFNSGNGTRVWGTYFGGNGYEMGWGLALCPRGRVYMGGWTQSSSGLATTGAYKTVRPSGNDGFLAEFTPAGQLLYSTYYGGSAGGSFNFNFDLPNGRLAAGRDGVVYMAGGTNSSNGIATGGAYQTTLNHTTDACLIAWFTDTTVYIKQPYTDTVWCPGDTVRIVYGVNQSFGTGNTFTVQLSNDTGAFINPVNIGSKAAIENDTITCVIPLNTPAGTGYRIRIKADSPARISQDNDWDIRIKAIPAAFGNSSNSPVCTGDTLHLLGSSTSTGITWLWTGPNSFSSSAKDSFIAHAQLTDSGKYILKATLNSTGCSLTDTTTVEMRLTPAKPVAGSNSPVCETLPLVLTTGSSTTGVSYTWTGPGSYSSSMQNPTVSTNASSSHAGDYISTATLNGCSSRDTTTVVVLPKPAKPTAGATNSPLCQRQDLQLTASTVTGASYNWYGPSAFTANTQNPVRANVQMADAGAYYVYATVNGCVSDTDSVVVTVNTDPFVNVFPTPGATVCVGQQVIFTAVPTNGGTTSYNWLVNGISTGSTGLTYSTTTLNNGDAVSCAMTSTGTCATPFIDTSNPITMTVQPKKAPSVAISADAGPSLFPNEPVNFTATATDAGSAPKYQWKRNGADVGGATGAVWGANANFLNDGDEICVLVTSDYACPDPDTALSNCIKLEIRVSVDDIVHDKNIKIYPNPVSGTLHIEGVEAGSMIELIDVLGRSARRQLLAAQGTSPYAPFKGGIDVSNLVPGVYIVKIDGVVAGRVVKE